MDSEETGLRKPRQKGFDTAVANAFAQGAAQADKAVGTAAAGAAGTVAGAASAGAKAAAEGARQVHQAFGGSAAKSLRAT